MTLGGVGRVFGQVGVSVVAFAVVGLALLPNQGEAAGAAQRLSLAGADLAALSSCALALAVIWLAPRNEAATSIALCLLLAAYGFALWSALPPKSAPEFLGLPRPFWAATTLAASILLFGGLARLSVRFPRAVSRDELQALVASWRRPASGRAPARNSGWRGAYRRSDKAFTRLVLSLPMTPGLRRRLARSSVMMRRQVLQQGRPVWPGSLLGLPWTGWSVGLVLAVAAGAAAALLPPDLRIARVVLPGAFAVVLFVHAVSYFSLCFWLTDAAERRKVLWAFAGLLGFLGIFMLAGLLQFVLELASIALHGADVALPRDKALLAPALLLGWLGLLACLTIAIFRDGALDPALVIRKTALYGLLAGALSILFVALEVAVARVVASQVQAAAGYGPAIAAAGVAATFRPAHRWLERGTRSWLERIAPATALAEGRRVRRVVAFSDLAGYTRLSAEDEASALTLASLFHKKSRKLAEQHDGRLVKTIGDAVLLEFTDVPGALAACTALPAELADGARALDLPAPVLRTGLHLGEVVCAPDGDLFGSTVNLAARLQTTAAPGELVASRAVVDAAGPGLRFEPLGARVLKNVPAPVDCWRVVRA